jgi:methylenetetrahydrofolate reductase (NADPH)
MEINMRIRSMFEKGTVFSFEIFPPKKTSPIETVYHTLEQLGDLHPDFISVTYGAAGSTNKISTCEIASVIKDKYGIVPAAHLPCINYTKEEILQILEDFKKSGIENILALRGDINPDIPPKHDFRYASELVEFISQHGDFDIAGACYPEGHVDARNIDEDIHNLKKKVDAGAQHLISQLFFDNSYFYSFLDKARSAGINVPIEAGIMPVVNKAQIERMVSMCGASLPPKFTKMMQRYENSPEAIRDAGIAYAVDQIVDLVSSGVDGIHIYTMNNPYVARRISEAVESLVRCKK